MSKSYTERITSKATETRVSTIKPRGFRLSAVSTGRHAALIAVSVVFLIPFYWMIASAVKDNTEIFAQPIVWWPTPAKWENFVTALNYPGFPYLHLLWNSVYYTGAVIIGNTISCAAAGYGFARLRFPGRNLLFIISISTMMIPSIVIFIPTFVLFKHMGLIGTYGPLIIPQLFGDAFYIFMLRQFFLGIPLELSEAARIDGAGEFRIFAQIMLPLVRPAIMVVVVFTLVYTWQDFFGPLIYLSDPNKYPLSLGLFAFQAQRTTEWALLMAAAALVTLPLILVFIAAQRYFLEGITMTGIKG